MARNQAGKYAAAWPARSPIADAIHTASHVTLKARKKPAGHGPSPSTDGNATLNPVAYSSATWSACARTSDV
jgi:hypothetical protein